MRWCTRTTAADEVRACGWRSCLGLLFTTFQAYEYSHAAFGFAGNIYGASFFMATGFHGFHVIIGTIFLAVCLFRAYAGQFTPTQHVGFEAAAWYWHFVDVVWLFLFAAIYIWGSELTRHAASVRRPATYQDVLDAPANMVAELVKGALHLLPAAGFAPPRASRPCPTISFEHERRRTGRLASRTDRAAPGDAVRTRRLATGAGIRRALARADFGNHRFDLPRTRSTAPRLLLDASTRALRCLLLAYR